MLSIWMRLKLSCANALNLDEAKFFLSGKGFNLRLCGKGVKKMTITTGLSRATENVA